MNKLKGEMVTADSASGGAMPNCFDSWRHQWREGRHFMNLRSLSSLLIGCTSTDCRGRATSHLLHIQDLSQLFWFLFWRHFFGTHCIIIIIYRFLERHKSLGYIHGQSTIVAGCYKTVDKAGHIMKLSKSWLKIDVNGELSCTAACRQENDRW